VPSTYKLKRAASHVDYEVWMLGETSRRLMQDGPNAGDEIQRRALLESWCVHLRNLIEFFHPNRRDTVSAADFVTDSDAWKRALPALTERERKKRLALHKMLAHLTYERYQRHARWAPIDEGIVIRRLALFLRHVTAQRRRWFPKAVDYLDGLGITPRVEVTNAAPPN
jgi:hypothetical protein